MRLASISAAALLSGGALSGTSRIAPPMSRCMCTCVSADWAADMPLDERRAILLGDSTVVFEGRTIAADSVGNSRLFETIGGRRVSRPLAPPSYTFEVRRSWGAIVTDTVTIYGRPEKLCPEPIYTPGKSYLVFVHPTGSRLELRVCGTAVAIRSRSAREDIEALGQPAFTSAAGGWEP